LSTNSRIPPTFWQYCWGLPILCLVITFTIATVMVGVVAGITQRLLLPWSPHSPKLVYWPYAWGLKYILMPLAGIQVALDLSEYHRPPPGTQQISVDVHPENLGGLLHSLVKTAIFGLRWRQVGKIELISGYGPIERLIGLAMKFTNCAVFINRDQPDEAVRALQDQARNEPGVTICTMLEGTRPKIQGIRGSRDYLRREGFPELAKGLLYTSCPRVRGLYELLRSLPEAQVLSVWCTATHHVEGITDIFGLIRAGGIHFKVVNWNDHPTVDPLRSWTQLTPMEKRSFAEAVYRFSIERAHPWMRSMRLHQESPVPLELSRE